MQERRNSIANALELRLSCINPLMCGHSRDCLFGIILSLGDDAKVSVCLYLWVIDRDLVAVHWKLFVVTIHNSIWKGSRRIGEMGAGVNGAEVGRGGVGMGYTEVGGRGRGEGDYSQTSKYKVHQMTILKCFLSRLVVASAQSTDARC